VRNEALNLYLLLNLDEVCEIVSLWSKQYNEVRVHDALRSLPPVASAQHDLKYLPLNCLLYRKVYAMNSFGGTKAGNFIKFPYVPSQTLALNIAGYSY
jgi:hypothetical protein